MALEATARGLRSICVFCGSAAGTDPKWGAAAGAFGAELARRRLRLVYGGSRQGLMGRLANACLEAGGEVVGVIPQALVEREAAHRHLSDLRVVGTLAERKAMMVQLADAFVALPGGYGTLDELGEVLTMRQLDLHAKPIGVLNVDGYYDLLTGFLDQATRCGFIREMNRGFLLSAADAGTLLDALQHAAESSRALSPL